MLGLMGYFITSRYIYRYSIYKDHKIGLRRAKGWRDAQWRVSESGF
jgi:hypothetical protein